MIISSGETRFVPGRVSRSFYRSNPHRPNIASPAARLQQKKRQKKNESPRQPEKSRIELGPLRIPEAASGRFSERKRSHELSTLMRQSEHDE